MQCKTGRRSISLSLLCGAVRLEISALQAPKLQRSQSLPSRHSLLNFLVYVSHIGKNCRQVSALKTENIYGEVKLSCFTAPHLGCSSDSNWGALSSTVAFVAAGWQQYVRLLITAIVSQHMDLRISRLANPFQARPWSMERRDADLR
jgi:hypothetical protein